MSRSHNTRPRKKRAGVKTIYVHIPQSLLTKLEHVARLRCCGLNDLIVRTMADRFTPEKA